MSDAQIELTDEDLWKILQESDGEEDLVIELEESGLYADHTPPPALPSQAKPPRRNLYARRCVLTRSSIAVSAAGSATSEESCTQKGPTVEVLQKVREWSADELRPRKITSEDEDSDASTEGECAGRGRPSMIPFISTRRKGVEMDVATKLANDMLLKAKEALEKSGNLKTEIKLTVIDSLQTLYDTCLALSDSRSRHKYNLERERTRHAQELVRAERAHTESVSKLTVSLTKELQSARSDIKANLESTEAVRRWLGYETQEPYAKISALLANSQAMEKRLNTLHASLADIPRTTEGKRSNKELEKLQTGVDNLSRQLDSLRREITTIKTSAETTAEDTKKALSTLVSSEDKATAAAALKETQASTKNQKILQESINDLATQRMDCESQIGEPLTKDSLHTILANTEARPHLLAFLDHLMAIVFNRNSTLNKYNMTETTHSQRDPPPPQSQPSTPPPPPALRRLNLQYHGEEGTPGIRLRGVTLFMDSNKEKIGIAFCEAHGHRNVTISPGLASLIKGSTTRNIMRRRDYNSLAQAQIAGIDCRIAREKGKEILLFDKGNNIS
ncbi:hypothetical protein K1T71_011621 [Dendrolimus kikuchii]|uniref:Uncharacterized protein n=1 Tax=Dendrolimus kikuchii TaxID=765133 RepID=A0ACC1CLY4_9NEOP|nr:hypothetical protein K1T71_011621 [Dendrolimus kikuchii]